MSLPQVNLQDLLELHKGVHEGLKLINIRGCNGAGKSTIPLLMLETDVNAFELIWRLGAKDQVFGTVFPSYNTIALGKYRTNCGGLDTVKDTATIKTSVKIAWKLGYNILMEGVLASTVFQTYADLFEEMNNTQAYQREIIIFNIVPSLETCLSRVKKRNGDKPIKEQLIQDKWKVVNRNADKFLKAGFNSLRVTNEGISREETLNWYFEQIGEKINSLNNKPPENEKLQINKIKQAEPLKEPNSELELLEYADCYVEPKENLKGFEWYIDYKAPNEKLKLRKRFFDSYWHFIAERMNIYHKRVVLGEPEPWTEDKVLKTYRFTNVVRDMDKLTIYERNHILSKIDEPVEDLEIRKKSILLNIMIFRVWVKADTYEVHGFIDLADKNWRKKWEKAKLELLDRRENYITNFTASYFVNGFSSANPDKKTWGNKTWNAILMIEEWMKNIDEIYRKAIIEPKNMKEQLEYFKSLTCVGHFTAYEYSCSIAIMSRYCKNHLVPWGQDNATNVGHGAKKGINWIFENKGGMSEYQCILYLRSIWRHELQKRGTYERFVSQLPKELNGDIDLRVIEHCLCESHKYNNAATEQGRPRELFSVRTTDVSELLV